MTFAAFLSLLLSIARAVPAIEQLFRSVVAERDKDREREAAQRLDTKNPNVDRAIDGPK